MRIAILTAVFISFLSLNLLGQNNTDLAPDPKPKRYHYNLGKSLQANNDFPAAKEAYTTFYEGLSNFKKKRFNAEYAQLLRECDYGLYAVNDSLPFFVINLGEGINSRFDEYGAVESPVQKAIYFTGRRPDKLSSKATDSEKFNERIFKAKFEDGIASGASAEPNPASSSKHIAVAGFDSISYHLFVYKGKNRSGQLLSYKIGGNSNLSRAYALKGAVNKKMFRETNISVANNGDAYFISDKPGGKGGFDIWFAQRKGKKRYKKARNLGDKINTAFDELSVHVTKDANTLYFASDGHRGMGGFDIYKSERLPDGEWGEPENLGYPLNTSSDDLFYFPTTDSLSALISSSRPGGYGGLDIYLLKKDPRIPFEIWGEVRDIKSGDILLAEVSVIDLDTNSPVATVSSDSVSNEYYIEMEDVGNFVMQVAAPGYKSETSALDRVSERHQRIRKDFYLEKLVYPYTIWGNITNETTGEPVQGVVNFKSFETEENLGSGYSTPATGYYSFTLADKTDIVMELTAENYHGKTFLLRKDKMLGDNGELNLSLMSSKKLFSFSGIVSEQKSDKVVPAAIAVYEAGDSEPRQIAYADTTSGRYKVSLDSAGPFLLELTATGYFFQNQTVYFSVDSTLLVRNFAMQPMDAGARIVVENILFNTGKATLRSESFVELDKLVRLLNENPQVRIEVSGHTDNVGSASLNKRLSKERALSVKNYLQLKGIDAARIEYEGYGFDRPIEPNTTEAGRAANRRVEIEVM